MGKKCGLNSSRLICESQDPIFVIKLCYSLYMQYEEYKGWLVSTSLIKRSLAVVGHSMIGQFIIIVPFLVVLELLLFELILWEKKSAGTAMPSLHFFIVT